MQCMPLISDVRTWYTSRTYICMIHKKYEYVSYLPNIGLREYSWRFLFLFYNTIRHMYVCTEYGVPGIYLVRVIPVPRYRLRVQATEYLGCSRGKYIPRALSAVRSSGSLQCADSARIILFFFFFNICIL